MKNYQQHKVNALLSERFCDELHWGEYISTGGPFDLLNKFVEFNDQLDKMEKVKMFFLKEVLSHLDTQSDADRDQFLLGTDFNEFKIDEFEPFIAVQKKYRNALIHDQHELFDALMEVVKINIVKMLGEWKKGLANKLEAEKQQQEAEKARKEQEAKIKKFQAEAEAKHNKNVKH